MSYREDRKSTYAKGYGTYKRRKDGVYGRPPTNTFENIEAIIREKTFFDPVSDCWIWNGAKNVKGYGHIRLEGKTVNIPRISGILFLGLDKNDSDTHVLHKCANKACWNPNHLYLGNNFDNWKDRKTGPIF